MTDRVLADLTAQLGALLTAIANWRADTTARMAELERRITRMETARTDTITTRMETWTALLKPIIIKIAIKMASPHFYAALTFLTSLIGKMLRSLLGF